MEYLIMAALFATGWLLAKIDSYARIRSLVTKQAEKTITEAFHMGVKHGAEQMYKQVEGVLPSQPTETKMGFHIPNGED